MPPTFEFPDQLDLTRYVAREAHDLRSPFNRIIGFTKLVLKGMDGPLTDTQREDLTTVYTNSAQALNMMNNLVDAARLGLNQKEVNCKEVESAILVGQAISHWQQNHPGREAHIEPEISAAVPSVYGDEVLLRQLIGHCLTYLCMHYADPVNIRLQVDESGGEVVFRLHAAGQPAQTAMQAELELTGYLCRALLKLHNGSIRQGQSSDSDSALEFSLPKAGR